MGFRIKIEGAETIELSEKNIEAVIYKANSPDESNAKATDIGYTLTVSGKIITAVDGEAADDTLKMATWALVPAEKADAYRKINLKVVAADQIVREINMPNSFIVDYTEDYGHTTGVGTFTLVVKQKKDKNDQIKIVGGFAAE